MTRPAHRPVWRPCRGPTIAAFLLAAVFLASSGLGPSASGGGAAPLFHSPAPARSAGPAASLRPASAGPAGVPLAAATTAAPPRPDLTTATVATIDLYNNSALFGNVQPRYANGPEGIAYNPVNHLEMISGGESCSAVLLDPTTGVVQSFPQPLVGGTDFGPNCALGGVAFDPVNDQTFVADQTASSVLVYNTSLGGIVTYDTSIPLFPGVGPLSMVVDPDNNRLFVADSNNSTVSVINAHTDTWITDVGVGDGPSGLVYDPAQSLVYVANSASDNITWIDSNTLTTGPPGLGASFHVPGGPVGIALAPAQDIIWTIEPGSPSYLTAFNSTSRAFSVNYSVTGAAPTGLFWDATQNELYATNTPAGSIDAFNMTGIKLTSGGPTSGTKKPTLTISTGGTPSVATLDSQLGEADLLDLAQNAIIRLPDSTQTVLGRTALGASPGGMAFNPITDAIMVTDTASNRVYEVNPRATAAGSAPIIGSFAVSGHPVDVAYDADTGWLVVASSPGTVTAIDPLTGSVNATVNVGASYSLWNILYADHQIFVSASSGYLFTFNATTLVKTEASQLGSGGPSAPRMMAYDPSTNFLYVALAGDNKIAVVNAASSHQTNSFAAAGSPYGIAYDPIGNHLFVVSQTSSLLTVMDPVNGAAVRTVPLGFVPQWISYNPYAQAVYVSNERSDSVTVVDPTFTQSPFQVDVGSYPGGITYSPVTGDMYVADMASSTLSVLPVANPLRAPFTANLTLSPPTTDVGVNVVISEAANLPAWALSYSYPTLPTGCQSQDVASLNCVPSEVGVNERVEVVVSNLAGDEYNLTGSITVNVPPQIVGFSATPNAVTVSKTVMLSTTVTGGVPPYRYTYTQVPVGCSAPAAPVWNCTPQDEANPFYVGVTVTDAVHYAVTALTNFTVNYVPQVVVGLSESQANLHDKVLINVNVTHGTAPFSYAYAGLPTGCASANVTPLACYPSSSGTFNIKVTVTDSSGYSTTSPVTLTVLSPSSSSSSSGSFLLIGIALLVLVVAIGVGLFLWRRSRPSGPATVAPSEPEPEVYGADSSSIPRGTVEGVAVAGESRAPLMPKPEVSSETPKYYAPAEDESIVQPDAPSAPSPSGPRAAVKCPHCGQMNQPWLINCRACSWPLAQT